MFFLFKSWAGVSTLYVRNAHPCSAFLEQLDALHLNLVCDLLNSLLELGMRFIDDTGGMQMHVHKCAVRTLCSYIKSVVASEDINLTKLLYPSQQGVTDITDECVIDITAKLHYIKAAGWLAIVLS